MAKGLWRWALMTMILTMTRVRQSVTSDSFHIRLSFSIFHAESEQDTEKNL